jgi:hypothetical protein
VFISLAVDVRILDSRHYMRQTHHARSNHKFRSWSRHAGNSPFENPARPA